MRIDDEKERLNDRANRAGEILFWKGFVGDVGFGWQADRPLNDHHGLKTDMRSGYAFGSK